jgi:hypothetical protein
MPKKPEPMYSFDEAHNQLKEAANNGGASCCWGCTLHQQNRGCLVHSQLRGKI